MTADVAHVRRPARVLNRCSRRSRQPCGWGLHPCFEYEAREIVKRAGIPVTDFGFTDAAEARAIAERIGGPTVIKSQVLTGGRMKAGGVKFADTPEEAEAYAADILALEINGHVPRGVLVDPKAEVKQEYCAGVVWEGTAKKPVIPFSDMGGVTGLPASSARIAGREAVSSSRARPSVETALMRMNARR